MLASPAEVAELPGRAWLWVNTTGFWCLAEAVVAQGNPASPGAVAVRRWCRWPEWTPTELRCVRIGTAAEVRASARLCDQCWQELVLREADVAQHERTLTTAPGEAVF